VWKEALSAGADSSLRLLEQGKGGEMNDRKRIGEIFIENGLITDKTLQRALTRAKRQKKRIGLILEEIEVITREELAKALADQFGYKVIGNFAHFRFSADLLNIIPVDMALQRLLFPLKIEDGKIAIAMADPTDTKILHEILSSHGLKVVPFIATRQEIITAINRHYLGKASDVKLEKTVMIVKYDRLAAGTLKDILEKEGYQVILASDGMEAYKYTLASAPHVIITDRDMPMLDGYGLLDALKSIPETRDIPMLLLADTINGDEEARLFQKGFFDFMTKPVKGATLITRVKRAFQSLEQQGLNLW
jgi:CheY-like chemotaxis protein